MLKVGLSINCSRYDHVKHDSYQAFLKKVNQLFKNIRLPFRARKQMK
jgi:hypothetical protein